MVFKFDDRNFHIRYPLGVEMCQSLTYRYTLRVSTASIVGAPHVPAEQSVSVLEWQRPFTRVFGRPDRGYYGLFESFGAIRSSA